MINKEQMVLTYKQNRSQTETARIFGVSRERIRQLLNKAGVNEGREPLKTRKNYLNCLDCKRSLRETKYQVGARCSNCYDMHRTGRKPFTHADFCGVCEIDLRAKHTFRHCGLCSKCWSRWRYFFEVGFKERIKAGSIRHYQAKKQARVNSH